MNPAEIRSIRGAMSRAAFASLLGVKTLTVLRWELPEGSKEARRPRPKMIEALRKLSSGKTASSTAEEGRHQQHGLHLGEVHDEDEDLDASEPVPDSAEEARATAFELVIESDLSLVMPLLVRLNDEGWARGELELFELAGSGRLQTAAGRALATIGLGQARAVGRFDISGALTVLMPILEDVRAGLLPPRVAAFAHVLAALLFCALDSRFFDAGRVNAHAAEAERLLDEGDHELRIMLVTARVVGGRSLESVVRLHVYREHAQLLERAATPVTQCFALTLHAIAAEADGDLEAANRYNDAALAIGDRLGMYALMLMGLADRCQRALRGPRRPEVVLDLVQNARRRLEASRLPIDEPYLIILGCEIEALYRAGRIKEASAVAAEALRLADESGVPRHPLAIPLARLYITDNRISELGALADVLEAESSRLQGGLVNAHAIEVRAILAGLSGNAALCIELAEEVCRAPESTIGIHFLVHDAYIDLIYAKLVLHDTSGAEEALRRANILCRQLPSVWHSAYYLRFQGYVFMQQGRIAEARQKLEATIATFGLLGDVVQGALARLALAMVARVAGAADADERFEAALAEIRRYCDLSPEILSRDRALEVPRVENAWTELSLTERLMVAVDRLSVQGLSPELVPSEMASILASLFPGRDPVVGVGEDAQGGDTVELGTEMGGLRIGVHGLLEPDQRAALQFLARMAPLLTKATRTAGKPEQAEVDSVLPDFIAAAPATKRLKAEVARLSGSSATILIMGESGTGKEVVAQAVHDLSVRARGPYVVFNCASVPRELFESQLFGHKRGSFTGALADSLGVIRAADGGTLFLDEIGELPLDTQPKLLRFLENAEVLPIGEVNARRVSVRVLAATHRDLARLVSESTFRQDLYYRLNVVPIRVPPLRERREDIVALARHFVNRFTKGDASAPSFAPDAVSALQAHTWPGNVRELRNVVERAMAYSPVPRVLHADHLRIAR
jgi:tetratricopeptide (TPR) repeat protein